MRSINGSCGSHGASLNGPTSGLGGPKKTRTVPIPEPGAIVTHWWFN